jgi:hypothetical protein
MLVAGVLGATGWALGSGIVEGANTSKLQGQLERKARDVKKDYVAGRIDQSKVEAVTVGAPISAYNEAVKIVKNPQDTPTVSEIITAQDGPALSGGEIPILPAELIKPPETPPSK